MNTIMTVLRGIGIGRRTLLTAAGLAAFFIWFALDQRERGAMNCREEGHNASQALENLLGETDRMSDNSGTVGVRDPNSVDD